MPGPLGNRERYLHYISLSLSSISFMSFPLNTSTVTSAVLYEYTLATSSIINSKKTDTSMNYYNVRLEKPSCPKGRIYITLNFLL